MGVLLAVPAAVALLSAALAAGAASPAVADEDGGYAGPAPAAQGATAPADPPEVAMAEPPALLESAWLVTDEADGKVRLVNGPQPDGAEERHYTARFRYAGEGVANGLQITVAIPEGMRYVENTAVGPGAEISFSIDHGERFGPPEALHVIVEPATQEASDPSTPSIRRAVPADYTHIRWRLPGRFLPGTAGLVSFRARPAQAATAGGAP